MSAWPATRVVFVAALATALATGLGAIPFAFVREMSARVIAQANAIAAGLMLGASFGCSPRARGTAARAPRRRDRRRRVILATQRLLGAHEPEFAGLRGAGARRMLLWSW
jgi:hypothetical protein